MSPRLTLRSPRRRPSAAIAWLLLSAAWLPVAAQELRFSTENDIFLHNPKPDDLYTFTVALEVERGPYHVVLRENAFTDRAAGTRFDETHLSVGRELPLDGSWRFRAEAGAVHVGRGILGQGTQNAVHRLLGSDQVELEYGDGSLHPRLAAAGERGFEPVRGLELAPRFEADAVPGLRSFLVTGVRGRWHGSGAVDLEMLIGARFDHVSRRALRPHIPRRGSVARLAVILADSVVVAWTYNEFGDGREHLGLSWRLPLARGAGQD